MKTTILLLIMGQIVVADKRSVRLLCVTAIAVADVIAVNDKDEDKEQY